MSKLHIAGSDLRINLIILRDGVAPGPSDPLASAILHYAAPDGTNGTWVASIDNPESGAIHHDVAGAENDTPGTWAIWAEALFTQGGKLNTGAASIKIWPKGTLQPA